VTDARVTHQDRTGEGSLSLDEQLCFALYAAQRAVTAAYRPLLDDLGLTYPQYLVLLVLWERGETTVKELAAALRLDYGTVSPLLKRLEAAGLVHRERSGAGQRTGRGGGSGPGAEVARLREELWGLAEKAHGAAERGR
jgi:DNA-binding transcriptional ArsR family regulator